MSILIKGIDMPKNGEITIAFASDENGENTMALIVDDKGKSVEHKGVTEIPTPHGRLIDCESDFFPTAFRHNLTDYAKGWNTCLRSVLLSPTIIEAEVSQ